MKFEDLYNQELASNERLRSALSLPLGLLIAIGSLLGLMLQSLWFERNSLAMAFYAAAFGSSWFFVQTMYYLVRSYHGHVYKGMPFPLTQHAYRDELREWHTKNGKGPQDGDREWEDAIEFQYAQAADHNARLNLNRSIPFSGQWSDHQMRYPDRAGVCSIWSSQSYPCAAAAGNQDRE